MPDMFPSMKLFHKTIRIQIIMAFLICFVFMVLIIAVNYRNSQSLAKSMQFFELAGELNSTILEMRRYEKNDFLYRQPFNFEENVTYTNKLSMLLNREQQSLVDEIGEMPLSMQVKLLRFIEERTFMRARGLRPIPVDLRLIAASNKNLKTLVAENQFREDLYYRLNVVCITLPPLRNRKDDIPLLVNHFLEKYCRLFAKESKTVSKAVLTVLASYPFPGNVRELANIIERAVALSDGVLISEADLPSDLRDLAFQSLDTLCDLSLEAMEKTHPTRPESGRPSQGTRRSTPEHPADHPVAQNETPQPGLNSPVSC